MQRFITPEDNLERERGKLIEDEFAVEKTIKLVDKYKDVLDG